MIIPYYFHTMMMLIVSYKVVISMILIISILHSYYDDVDRAIQSSDLYDIDNFHTTLIL
jgi:hypothetical protein